MADPINPTNPVTERRVVRQESSPWRQPPHGETIDCNSGWGNGVQGLTTDALRNALSLSTDVCTGKHEDVDGEEVSLWYSINSVDATSNGGGRTWNYVAAEHNAAMVGGNLICREDGALDWQDNEYPITLNMGAQSSANAAANHYVSVDIDADWNESEHKAITSMLDDIKMPSWSNRLVYYFGANIPQGFLCTVARTAAGAYVDTVKAVLSDEKTPHGFETTAEGSVEKMDGVLTFVSAVSSERHDKTVFDAVMKVLGKIPGWDEFAEVLYAGRDYREAFAALEQIKVADKSNPETIKNCERTRALIDSAMGSIGICDASRLNPDQKEVMFTIEGALVEMLSELGKACVPQPPPPRKCNRDGVVDPWEDCDPKAPDNCGAGKHCNRNCKCVSNTPPPPPPPPKVEEDWGKKGNVWG